MSVTNTPRNTPAPDGQRWRTESETALLCAHCRTAHSGRPGVTWTNSRWIVDWVCPACGTAITRSATDAQIQAWSDTLGPWSTAQGNV
jgi:predicted RNA-binding Zn-ribbon protein involved in translation (DUF1610 family)